MEGFVRKEGVFGLNDLRVSAELIRQVEILDGIEAVKALVIRTSAGDVEIERGGDKAIIRGSDDLPLPDNDRHGFFVALREGSPLKHREDDVLLPQDMAEELEGINHPAIVGLRLEIAEGIEALISARKGPYPKGIAAEEAGVVRHEKYAHLNGLNSRAADIDEAFFDAGLTLNNCKIQRTDIGFQIVWTLDGDLDLPVFSRHFSNGFELQDMEESIDNDRDAFAFGHFKTFQSRLISFSGMNEKVKDWIQNQYGESMPFVPSELCYVKKKAGKTFVIWDFKVPGDRVSGPSEQDVDEGLEGSA